MKIKIPFGETFQYLEIEKENLIGILEAKDFPPVFNELEAIKKALNNPVKSKILKNIVNPSDKVVIVINDITRPTPSKLIVEAIAKHLNEAGIPDSNITLVVATGSHRANTKEELKLMVGEDIINRFKIENHDCKDEHRLKFIGYTKRGMPLSINKTVAEADIKILTGVIAPHHTAGFSGGRKSIVPGVAGFETLKLHHSLPIRPFEPSMGEMESNPFHQEAVEAAKMAGVDFILNLVQNSRKQTVAVVAGDLEAAHKRGVEICRQMCQVEVPGTPDIVITSPGGYPRDINLYQSQKAVSSAEKIVRENGVIVLVAECRNGVEKSNFPLWLKQAKTPQEVVDRFKKEGFSVGSNKAFMFARALTKFKIIVVTKSISEKELGDMFMMRADSAQDALKTAYKLLGENSKVLIMPNATSIVPKGGNSFDHNNKIV